MKLAVAIVLFIILVFVGLRVYAFMSEERALSQNLTDVSNRLKTAQSDEADLEAQTKYLSNPANMQKELRSQFNYKRPGESMIILVPRQSSTTAPATP